MKKIVFDARMYGLKHAGIGRYVLSLLKNFQFSNSNFQITLLVKKEKLDEIKGDLGSQFKYYPVKSRHYSFFEQIEIPFILRKLKPDLVHFPHFNAPILWRGKFVVTIHDLIKHYFTGRETTTKSVWLYRLKHWAYKLQVNHALYKSSLIFVPSEFWRQRLADDFDVLKEKIMVTPEAVDENYLKGLQNKKAQQKLTDLDEQSKYKLKPPYLIYTGSVYPHKNIDIVFQALQELTDFQLGIACSRNVFTKRVENKANQMGLENRVKFLGFVPDPDLIELYQNSVALIQPSLMEGFGLTGLEAMAANTPVIAADASCLPEVYGEASLYFNANDSKDLIKVIRRLKNNKTLRRNLIAKGKKQVSQYSWKKTAQLTLEGYKKVL